MRVDCPAASTMAATLGPCGFSACGARGAGQGAVGLLQQAAHAHAHDLRPARGQAREQALQHEVDAVRLGAARAPGQHQRRHVTDPAQRRSGCQGSTGMPKCTISPPASTTPARPHVPADPPWPTRRPPAAVPHRRRAARRRATAIGVPVACGQRSGVSRTCRSSAAYACASVASIVPSDHAVLEAGQLRQHKADARAGGMRCTATAREPRPRATAASTRFDHGAGHRERDHLDRRDHVASGRPPR